MMADSMRRHITVLGSLNYDLVAYTPKVPVGGETTHMNSFSTHCGGKGSNQALATRRLSSASTTDVRMIGRVGSDSFGETLKKNLADSGADVSMIDEVEGESGIAVILVEDSGENRILVNAGANGTLTPDDITPSIFMTNNDRYTDYLIVQNELAIPVVLRAIDIGSELGIKVVYNPSPISSEVLTAEVLSKCSYIIVNESEFALLLGNGKKISEGAMNNQIAEVYSKYNFEGTLIVTHGKEGSYFYTKDLEAAIYVPSFSAKHVVDTTGAGDSFLGAFVGAIANGSDPYNAIKFASAAGCLAVGKKGAAESIPTLEEVKQFLAQV
ncbi:Ribokinase-like protein [Dipodascopsis uninucleata]